MSRICNERTCILYCDKNSYNCRAQFTVADTRDEAIVLFRQGRKLCPQSRATLEAAEIVRREGLKSGVPKQL